jgi:hypothetical protein
MVGAVVTAAGLCLGALGLYQRSEVLLAAMVISIALYGLMRVLAWIFEHQVLQGLSSSRVVWSDAQWAALGYMLGAVITAAGLCLGALGLYRRSGALLVAMVISIASYGLMRVFAWHFENNSLKRSIAEDLR